MIFRSIRGAAILALLLALAPPARAQDAEALGLARDLMVAMRTSDNFDAVLPTVMQALKPALTQGNPKAAQDYDEILPLMMQEFSGVKDGLVTDMAAVYAKAFEKDELRQFIAFYQTPAGAKMARETPALAQQIMAVGQRFGQQVAVKVAARIREELRKRGNDI